MLKTKNYSICLVLLFSFIISACFESNKSKTKKTATADSVSLAQAPPMGWNSFDSYGVYLYEEAAYKNLEVMAEKLKPFGYEYFVVDNGWFGEYNLQEGTSYPAERHASDVKISEHGLLQPSDTYFPNGIKALIDRTHKLGLKFGIHLMRGIPRKAYRLNTPILGTSYTARDIADTTSICKWCEYNYGVDMRKPGSQEFYNSLVNQLAEWGVDFIKADDIVPYPKEVEAMAKAIAQCGRPMVLSLSPGDKVDPNALSSFQKANMLRVTPDIWDSQEDIDKCFAAWRKWTGKEGAGFWIDMDMIPFGKLQLMSPPQPGISEQDYVQMKDGKLEKDKNFILLSGRGYTRQSKLTKDQMFTFITLRAMAASPLMMGGDLITLDSFSLSLITNKEMIACNQNGVMGKLIHENSGLEIWQTPDKKNQGHGWLGVFNRTGNAINFSYKNHVALKEIKEPLKNIWKEMKAVNEVETVNVNGVLFIKY